MSIVKLELSYGTLILYNLSTTWIQPLTMNPEYMLCYEDDKYKRNSIYRSTDKNHLIQLQEKIMTEINEGKRLIKLL